MGYWIDRRKEEDAEIAGVLVSIFPRGGECMGKVVPKSANPSSDENIIPNSFPTQGKEEPPDDVKYNEEWWKWYCKENNLDVSSGKSLRGGSSRDIISYEDVQDYLSF